jgi:hypothetical protein
MQYFTIAQNEIDFPYDVKFDPRNPQLSLLKIKKVERISKHYFYNDTTSLSDTINSEFGLDYVFTYDSIFHLISMKYDFQPEFDLNISSDDGHVQIMIHNLRLYLGFI